MRVDSEILAAIIGLTRLGPVVPITWPVARGGVLVCSCGHDDCSSPAKHPLTRSGLTAASSDPAQIEHWLNRWPRCNWAVRTGDVAEVVDIDTVEAFDRVAAIIDADPATRHVGPVGLTGRDGGGWHLWFAASCLRNVAGTETIGIPRADVRGVGGYAVVAPSRHVSGGLYAWAAGAGPECALEPMPDVLREALYRRREPERRPITSSPRVTHLPATGDRETRYAAATVAGICDEMGSAQVGGRNATLNRLTFRLRQLIERGKIPGGLVPDAVDRLHDAAASTGLTDTEIERTMTSALSSRGTVAS